MSLRESVRRIPLAKEAYEYVTTQWGMRKTKSKIDRLLRSGTEIKIDLGGGYQPGRNGWLNVDVSPQADLFWDLRFGIPFPDGSVHHIYSSHLFEHLTFEQTQGLLRECIRVLVPGGSFSIAVPDARRYIEAYVYGTQVPGGKLGWEPADNGTTAIDAVNYVAYMGGEHRYMFDQENLIHILTLGGLDRVSARLYDATTDLRERDFESIYAIGFAPES